MNIYGPCEVWPVLWPCNVSTESPITTGQAVEIATHVVWALSGRQYGLCTVELRPCRDDSLVCSSCETCVRTCACGPLSEVTLPGPVDSIVEVRVDGVALPTGSYRLDDDRKVVRVDGQAWPRCDHLELDDSKVGTWSITARFGQPVPELGKWAVGELACELVKAIKGEDCRLPRNVTQLVRQGVTIQYPDVGELFRQRRTGLYLTDAFITTVNPHGLTARSRVYSVDRPPHRRVGT